MKSLRLGRELGTAVVTAVLCSLWTGSRLLGGGVSPAQVPQDVGERVYERAPGRFAEFMDDDFTRYWQGKHIFQGEVTTKLPIPRLHPPESREEEPAAPLFRPGPALEAYNRLAIPSKYAPLASGLPTIAEADLPPAADLEALKKLEEPARPLKPDKRSDRERQFFVAYPKGMESHEGRLLLETETEIRIEDRKTKGQRKWLKTDLVRWEYNRTYEEQYPFDSQNIKPGSQEAAERVKLARRLAEDLGMIPEAKAELRKAIERKKDHLDAILFLGRLCFQGADIDGAVAVYKAGLSAEAPAPEMHYEIGRCLRAISDLEGAAEEFERSLEASPRYQKAKVGLARTQLELGQQAAAIETAADFLKTLAGANDTTTDQKVEAFLVRGLAFLRTGDLAKAKQDLSDALRMEAQNAEAINALAVVAALEGNFKQAGAGFVAALKAHQYLTDAWSNLGALLLRAGKTAEAEAVYSAAADRDPISAEVSYGMALAQLLSGKKGAPATIERALKLDPSHAPACALLGLLRLRDGADDEALTHFTAALRSDFAYVPSYSGAAVAYLRLAARAAAEASGEKDEAKAATLHKKAQELGVNAETLLLAVTQMDRSRPGLWIALGCAYAGMNRPEEARNALRTARTLISEARKPIDPLVQYAAGYVEYLYASGDDEARLDASRGEFEGAAKLEGAGLDAVSARAIADCKRIVEDIDNWKVTGILLDDRFEREASKDVGAKWIESERQYNVAITLDRSKEHGGRCKFSGKQAGGDGGMTLLERDIPSENFHALEATFFPEKVEKCEYGFSLYTARQGNTKTGFHVGVDMQGKVKFNPRGTYPTDMDRRDMAGPEWKEIKMAPPNPKEITLSLVYGENNRSPAFDLYFYDAAKGEWILAQKDIRVNSPSSRGPWIVSIFGRGWKDREYAFYVDNVRVLERSRR